MIRKKMDLKEMQTQKKITQRGFLQTGTLEEWIHIWLEDILPNVVKESTIQMYMETMEHHVYPVLGSQRLEDITEKTIQDWVKYMQCVTVPGTQNGRMTEGTIRNILSVLSGCMREAQKHGLIENNPCLESAWAIKCKNIGNSHEWLSEEEIAQLEPLIASYKAPDGYPIGLGFQLVIYAGITLSEAAALRWKNVDLEGEKIQVEYFVAVKRWLPGRSAKRTCELEPLTGRKKREIPIPACLRERLREVRESYHGEDEEFVLCKSTKEPIQVDRMRAVLKRWSIKCGMREVTPQMLRDTYAMRAVHTGADSDTIAELMGFASTHQVIRRYMPLSAANKRELVDRMFGIK